MDVVKHPRIVSDRPKACRIAKKVTTSNKKSDPPAQFFHSLDERFEASTWADCLGKPIYRQHAIGAARPSDIERSRLRERKDIQDRPHFNAIAFPVSVCDARGGCRKMMA